VDLLVALNTGHEGGFSTVHANAAPDVPARLEALAALAGLDRAALHSQLASAVQAVVHITRFRDGIRKITDISILFHDSHGLVRVLNALRLRHNQPPSMDSGGRATTGVVVAEAGGHILDRLLAERGGPRPDILRGTAAGGQRC
jgi:pilus assembly protein CpaF